MIRPGTRLLELSFRHLDRAIVESVVLPTLADMQHEVLASSGAVRRWEATVRGHVALARLFFLHGIIWRSPMRRWLIVITLGVLGSALWLGIRPLAVVGPDQLVAFFVMAVVTPLVLHRLNAAATFRQQLAGCLTVGMLMAATFLSWTFVHAPRTGNPWYAYVVATAFLVGSVAFGSTLAASFGWTPVDRSAFRRRMAHVATAWLVFVASYGIFTLSAGYIRGTYRVLGALSWGMLLGFCFAAVAVAVYLPALVGARRILPDRTTRVCLTALGALLFPIPLLVFPLFQGRLLFTADYLLHAPGAAVMVALPYMAAGATLGWLLGGRQSTSPQPSSC